MTQSLADLIQPLPVQRGNGGHYLVPAGLFKDAPAKRESAMDKTAYAASLIIDSEKQARAAKTAKLKAAREARDEASGTSGNG